MSAMYGREGITPGRVINAGGASLPDGTRYDFGWLYIVTVQGETVYGVLFNNSSRETARATWYGTTLDALDTLTGARGNHLTHTLDVVLWWSQVVADFLALPFPGGLPTATPVVAPMTTDAGDMIPRAQVVDALTRASHVASDYADSNELCGEFERCIEAIGLEEFGLVSRRERERYWTVHYTGEVETSCEHCGSDTTESGAQEYSVWITSGQGENAARDRLFEDLDNGYTTLPGWDGDTSDVTLVRQS